MALIRPSDTIEFYNHDASKDASKDAKHPSFQRRVKKIHRFATFREALEQLSLSDVLPGVSDRVAGEKIYEQFVSMDTQKRDGICMIEFEDLKTDPY